MIDLQGDVIDHRKRAKSLGQATQIHRRQIASLPLFVLARISARLGIPVYGQKRDGKGSWARNGQSSAQGPVTTISHCERRGPVGWVERSETHPTRDVDRGLRPDTLAEIFD